MSYEHPKVNGESNASTILTPIFGNIPPELAAVPNWLGWAAVLKPGKDKPAKLPKHPDGYLASTTKPSTWSTFAAVKAAHEASVAQGHFDYKDKEGWHSAPAGGVGFVFDGKCDADGNTLIGIDFDGVLKDGQPADNVARRLFQKYGKRIASYTEKSPRGMGAHIIVKAPPLPRSINHAGVEMYSCDRYFTVTGHIVAGLGTVNAAPEVVQELYDELCALKAADDAAKQAPGGARVIPFRTPQPVFEQPPPWLAKLKAAAAQAAAPSEMSAGINSGWYEALPDILKSEAVRHAALHLAAHSRVFERQDDGGNHDDYYKVALAIKQSGVSDAEDIFVEANRQTKNPDTDDGIRGYFTAQKPNGTVTIGTLFWYAEQRCAVAADFSKYKSAVTAAAVGSKLPSPATPATATGPAATATAPTTTTGATAPAAPVPVSAVTAAAVAAPFPDLDKNGHPLKTYTNAMAACVKFGVTFQLDTFHNRMTVGGHPIQQWAGELSDNVCRVLRKMTRVTFGFDPGKDHISEAAATLCIENSFNPVLNYVDGLTWDGVPRLDTWVVRYLGAEDTPFNRAVGRIMLTAAVRRVRRPGTKFDQIIVFEGSQGSQKSTAVEVLAGKENFSDQTILGKAEKEQQELCAGVWLYEIADLAGMRKAEIDQTKAFASRTYDRARPAYGRYVVSQPRTCAFIATTNNSDYLKDDTGNRRFWPLRTGTIDIDALRRDRDQLWAEAAHYEATGVSIVLPQNLWADAAVQQEARREPDPWEAALADVQGTLSTNPVNGAPEYRVLTDELFIRLGIPTKDRNDFMAKRIARCMSHLCWTKPDKSIRIGGKQGRGFVKPVAPVVAPATVQPNPPQPGAQQPYAGHIIP
jgi:Virulence-associated protein E